MPTRRRLVIYGAYGFTGRLLVTEAVRRGHRPILAGRSLEKLAPVAEASGLEAVAVALDDREGLERLTARASVVLHAAGPFAVTSEPMIRACLAQRAHYVDLTGELPVLRATFGHDRRAKEAGVALISGAGFDVVPSDCLALHVARRIEKPTRVRIAVAAPLAPTAGTVRSALEVLPAGGLVHRHGELEPGPFLAPAREVRFVDRTRRVVPVPLGDLETAARTTGAVEVETFAALPRGAALVLRAIRPLLERAVANDAIRARLTTLIDAQARGPSASAMASQRAHVWAWAENARGQSAESALEGPEAYAWTARLAWDCVERLERGERTGALTPALAFGPDLPLGADVTRVDQ